MRATLALNGLKPQLPTTVLSLAMKKITVESNPLSANVPLIYLLKTLVENIPEKWNIG